MSNITARLRSFVRCFLSQFPMLPAATIKALEMERDAAKAGLHTWADSAGFMRQRAEAAETKLAAARALIQALKCAECICDGGEQGDGLCAIPHEPYCPGAASLIFGSDWNAALDAALTALEEQ